jgi:hypothetical protein
MNTLVGWEHALVASHHRLDEDLIVDRDQEQVATHP